MPRVNNFHLGGLMETAWYFSGAKQIETLHDLESPLLKLGSMVRTLTELPRAKRMELNRTIEKMENILRGQNQSPEESPGCCNLRNVFVDAILEKRSYYRDCKIEFDIHPISDPMAAMPAMECSRVVSNCLDHFLAAQGDCSLSIKLYEWRSQYKIVFLAPQVIQRSGSLPLHLAATKIRNWNGSLQPLKNKKHEILELFIPSATKEAAHTK